MDKKAFSTTLHDSVIQKLKFTALEERRNSNEVIEEALNDYFKKKEMIKNGK